MTSAVYVSVVDDVVVGYFALAMASLTDVPKSIGRGMPRPIPAIRIARFGVDRRWQGVGNGARLLVEALRLCLRGGRDYGARVVIVDAVNDEVAHFYEKMGFKVLEDRRLWRKMTDVAATFESSSESRRT